MITTTTVVASFAVFLALHAGIAVVSQDDPGHCVWYGQCGHAKSNNLSLNCLYNGTAKPLTEKKAVDLLEKLCPEYASGDVPHTCCDYSQLQTLDANMALPRQFFLRCPSCFKNFLHLYCALTCNPEHSHYLHVNESEELENSTQRAITALDFAVSIDFSHGLFNSCKDVQYPGNNQKAISLFCGKAADQCTPQDWLNYMGDINNQKTPFQINFNLTDSPIFFNDSEKPLYPMNDSITPCSLSSSNDTQPCSCLDCESACAPMPPPIPPPQPWTILNIDGLSFIMACCFIAFLVFFLPYSAFLLIKSGRHSSTSVTENELSCCSSINSTAVIEEKPSCSEKLTAEFEKVLQNVFVRCGTFCARYPVTVILAGCVVAAALSCGIIMMQVTTDPVELWAQKESTARKQKDYYDTHFMPFFRTEQMIITVNNATTVHHEYYPQGSQEFGPVFHKDILHQVLSLQLEIEHMSVYVEGLNRNITLHDICFAPLKPDNTNCTIQSVLQYYQNDHDMLDKKVTDPDFHVFTLADYIDHFMSCASDPAAIADMTALHTPCLGTFGGPVSPWVILGGYPDFQYGNASALVISFIVENRHDDSEFLEMALAWEKAYISHLKSYKNENITIAYSSERSIEDEIERESSSDVITILVSYLIMFTYVSIALGQVDSCYRLLLDTKISLGLGGVMIVFVSVTASIGTYSYAGIPVTLIIIEVVPFLVLAVGVDNIFILVQAYQRSTRRKGESLHEHVGRIVGEVGPSMLLSSLSECTAFFIGSMSTMPAVRAFSLYAALAVLFDFLLQITCFVGLLTLDSKRHEKNRFDVCCCIGISSKGTDELKSVSESEQQSCLYKFVQHCYAPALLSNYIRPIVITVFVGWILACGALVNKIEVGLDQKLSMPEDSFVLTYFTAMEKYLSVGPPVYFVVSDGLDYTTRKGQDKICGGNGCPEDSLLGQVYAAQRQPNSTYIAHPASSWLDDYFDWSATSPCCQVYNGTDEFCSAAVANDTCVPCDIHEDKGRPVEEDFVHYLQFFLQDNPNMLCAKGGHAAYGTAVELLHNNTEIGATYFMTYHTVLKTSADYIGALKSARDICENITKTVNVSNVEVFPYSVFYVFYEQYLNIIPVTIQSLGLCLAAIFLVTTVLLGFDVHSAILIIATIFMILMSMFGMMYLWDIPLNAVSLVNLVMTVGIAVEFCSHIARAFATSTKPTRVERSQDALTKMGSSVLSGITLTKFGGIVVLAFSKSQIFQVFYFRMYVGIVLFGAVHGLIFLPVFLSYLGPSVNKQKLLDEEELPEEKPLLKSNSHSNLSYST